MVDSQESPTGAMWEMAPHRVGGMVASRCPSLKHTGTGNEGVAPSSWMRGSGRQYLDFKCSESQRRVLRRRVGMTYILKETPDVKNKSGGDRVTAGIRQAAVKQSIEAGW